MVDQTAAPDGGAPAYEPDAETQKKVSETLEKRDRFKKFRQSRDQQTFVNFAFLNGQQYVEWSAKNATLTVPPAPPHRIRLALNKIRPKIEARRAKIFRNRTRIECAPATADQQDRMNAKASTKALDYIMRKEKWEEKKRHAWMWAEVGGKGFLWLHWDPQALGQVLQEDPLSGEATPTEGVVGDVRLEVGSPFEVLVADPTNPSLAGQVEILRIKLRPVADMKGKYPEFAGVLVADAGGAEDLFRFERRIGTLSQTGWGGMSDTPSDEAGNKSQVMVTEHFKAPCATYPKGLYRVLVGKVLVHEGTLPFEMWDMPNPYPVVAFSDIASPAQFWNTTLIEQLIPLQREYNLARSKFAEWMRLNVNNKIIVWKQHRLPKNAWTSEPGEILELFWVPGLPPPMIIQPPPIGADFWNGIQLIGKEFDDISQVFPAAEGKAAGATSGFQTNLLQEATDSVHQPLLEHVLAQEEELARKMRRVMRLGYSVPRLISVSGKRLEPEVLEFKASQIDETGDVVVAAGGALPDLKATRISMVNDMFKSGILGNPAEPDTQRKALSLMNMGGADEALDQRQIDENLARIENLHFEHDTPVEPPVFYQDHQIHYETHIERLKSPDTLSWPEERRLALITHTVATLDYLNPVAALEAAAQFGLNPPPRALSMLKQQQVLQSQAGTKDVDGTAAVPAGAPAGADSGPLPVS